jgi:iron complex transport system substrate-binding protein
LLQLKTVVTIDFPVSLPRRLWHSPGDVSRGPFTDCRPCRDAPLMRRRPPRSPLGIALALAFGLAIGSTCAMPAAAEIIVDHDGGRTVLPKPPAKVLVLDLSALDILDALGVEVAGVPSGVKPAHLAKYQDARFPKIGTLFEPDYEAINAAAPDLVIAGGRSKPKVAALARIAPTVDLTGDWTDPVGTVSRNVETLARVFGKTEDGRAQVAALRADLEGLRARGSTAGKALVLLTTGGKVSAFGPGSRFSLLYDALGFAPAAPELKVAGHGQPVSFEFVAKADPDWLFVVDRDAAVGTRGQPARQLLDNDLVRQTSAWSRGRVVYLDAGALYLTGGGLTALRTILRQVGAALDAAR